MNNNAPPTDPHWPTDPRCERVRLLLSLAIDRAATPQQQREIDDHLPACAGCRTSTLADRAVRVRLQEPAVVPAGFKERVLAAITRQAAVARSQNRFLMAGAAAAVVIAALSVALLRPDGSGDGDGEGETVAAQDERVLVRDAVTVSFAAGRVAAPTKENR